jgi:flagellar biosynthesis protein FliR
MNATVFFAWAFGALLASIRVGMLFVSTPVFGNVPIPKSAKVILVVGLGAAFATKLNIGSIETVEVSWLVSAIISEMLIGAAMASALFAGFAAFNVGGRLLDFQIGYGIAGLVDIATKNNMPLIGSMFSMVAVLIFFAIDGHLAMFRVVQLSYTVLPIGSSIYSLNIGALIAYFGTCFAFGFAVVAPVVLCLFLVDIGMAFMSRTMPQMNVFVMSLSLKVIVGLIVLAISFPFAGSIIRQIFNSIFESWNQLLG